MDKSKRAGIHTDYTSRHIRKADLCGADFVFRVGAVVLDGQGDVLVFEDEDTGALRLPRSCPLSTDDLEEPLRLVSEQTGLKIDPLPLLVQSRRYRRPELEEWGKLQQDLVFDGEATTTEPFSIALDVNWTQSVPKSELLDAQQVFISWHSGVVRHSSQPDWSPPHGARWQFISIDDLSDIMLAPKTPYDGVGRRALQLFRVLWSATKDKTRRS